MEDNMQNLENPGQDLNAQKEKTDHRKTVLSYLHDLTYLLTGILLVFLLLFRVVVVSGSSMKNTLVDGDYILLLNSVFYAEPQAGDIIVASKQSFEDGEPIIKRVIATEGQTVKIIREDNEIQAKVYVDGVLLDEPYIATPTTNDYICVTVDEGCVFVMGDNRQWSRDSRSQDIGQIDRREILGKALFLFIPGTDKNATPRDFGRIGGLW